jgi:hypothetical protein
MSLWANVFLGNRLSGQMSFWANVFWANVFLGKCLSGQMSFWANVFWANVFLGKRLLSKCHLGKCLSGQMYFLANVVWANDLLGKCRMSKCLWANVSEQMLCGQMSWNHSAPGLGNTNYLLLLRTIDLLFFSFSFSS